MELSSPNIISLSSTMSGKSTKVTEATSARDLEATSSSKSVNEQPKSSRCMHIIIILAVVVASMTFGAGAYWAVDRFILGDSNSQNATFSATENSTDYAFAAALIDKERTAVAALVDGKKPTEGTSSAPVGNIRLPNYARPISYNLTVQLYLPGYKAIIQEEQKLKFSGNVQIRMSVTEKTYKIVLNSHDIQFAKEDCKLTEAGSSVAVQNVIFDVEFRKVTIELEREVFGEDVLLEIKYMGDINDDLSGLYRSTYTNQMGETKIVAVTQMEPDHARLFVPCFDEPEYRATWEITVIHPEGTTALSNGMEKPAENVGDNFLSTSFETTPSMSSYLLAIFVSDFVSIQKPFGRNGNKTMRIWCRPEAISETQYALEAGVKVTNYYENMFGIDFPLQKQDMIALPDFSAGAMENWGIITYREDALLYNNITYTLNDKKNVAVTIAHELAHQWFGNLVTMKWWNDLWLNEGFATYVEAIGTAEISEYLGGEDHAIAHLTDALRGDSLASSRPLTSIVETMEEIQGSFDGVSYSKGGSLIRMIKYVMGKEAFNEGIKAYLKKFSYRNTESIDLWNTLSEFGSNATHKGPNGGELNVTELALQWTDQMGYPLLTATTSGDDVIITQKRYKTNKNATELAKYANPKYGFKWDVPVWYETEGKEEHFIWVPRDEAAVIKGAASKTIILNSGVRSFVRVNYCKKGWNKIIKALKEDPNLFTRYSRFVVLMDAFEMASVGEFSYEKLFELASYGEKETENLPLQQILGGIRDIGGRLGTQPESKLYRKYVRKILKSSYDKISLDDVVKTANQEELKDKTEYSLSVWGSYCGTKAPDCRRKIVEMFEERVKTPCSGVNAMASKCCSLLPEIRKMVYCYGIGLGDEETYKMMMGLYLRELDPTEKNSLMGVLTCTNDVSQLKTLLETSLDRNSSVFRMQDAIHNVYSSVSGNAISSEFILNHSLSNWDSIYERFNSTAYTTTIIRNALRIRNEVDLEQLHAFLNKPEHKGLAAKYHTFKILIEQAENSLEWKRRHFKKVTEILERLSA